MNFYFKSLCRPPVAIPNLLIVMKLTVILVIISVFHVTASTYAQRLTIKKKNAPLVTIFKDIRKQAGYDFLYSDKLIKQARPVDVDIYNGQLENVLKVIFENQPFDYHLQGTTIVLKARPNVGKPATAVLTSQQLRAQGTVTDQSSLPLSGVTVSAVKSGVHSITDAQGRFSINLIQAGDSLRFTSVGYKTSVIFVKDQKQLRVKLEATDTQMQDVVVTGYSRVKRESYTGAAKTITRQELEKFNNNNIFSIIQSLDPAFKMDENVLNGSNPNALPQINIRGLGSVGAYAVNAPLIIMDGFEVSISTLYDLDVNRIESISILKDASSTSMYGSRGSNGVITIETRLPKMGKFTITYDAKPSITMVDLSDYNMMNAQEKLAYEKVSGIYTATGTTDFTHIEQEFYDNLYASRLQNVLSGVDTYWLKQPVHSTFSINHSLRMEGGANDVRYSLEGNYNDFKGVMKESGRIRGGAAFNLNYRLKDKITFSNVASYQYTKEYNSPYGAFSQYVDANPYERIYDDQGKYIIRYGELGQFYEFGPSTYNPLYNTTLGFRDDARTHFISNNMLVDWFISNSFRIRARGLISRAITSSDKYTSPFHTSFFEKDKQIEKGSYAIANGNSTQYNGNIQLEYSKNIDKHQIMTTLLGEIRSENRDLLSHLITGYTDDRFISPSIGLTYALNSLPETESLPKRAIGVLGNLFYTYDGRYVLSGSLRSDGSSLYGKANRFGTFWSTGLAYNVHNEKWFHNNVVNKFRLRGNIGTNGSENFNGDMINTGYKFVSGHYYYKQYAAQYNNQGNPNVSWPVVKQLSLGTEISLFRDLVSLDLSVYDKRTSNMISHISVAPSFGFFKNSYVQNLGEVSNKGFEINTNFRVWEDTQKDLSWYLTIGAVQNRSKLLKISNELSSLNESLEVKTKDDKIIKPSAYFEQGQSLTIIRGMRSLGIDPASGREMYLTPDGEVTYTWDAKNRQVIGDLEVNLFGNISTAFNYKRLSVQIFGNYSLGGDIYNQTLMDKIENNSPFVNADKRVLEERWKQPGDHAKYKSIADKTTTEVSSRFVQKENFFHLSSININYDFPAALVHKYNLQRMRVNFSTNDMFRFSTVRMERGIDYPYARTYNFGVMVQF